MAATYIRIVLNQIHNFENLHALQLLEYTLLSLVSNILNRETGCPSNWVTKMFLLEFVQEIGGFTVVYGLRKEDTIITENKGSKGATPSINFPNSTMRF